MSFQEIWDFITKLIHPQSIIEIGGLPLVFIVVYAETGLMAGFFLPGDSLLFLTGLFCSTGLIPINIFIVLAVVLAAAVLGDNTGYYVGKKLGKNLFTRKESLLFKPEYVEMTKKFFDKYGGKALVLGRFLPIIRTFAPVLAGVVEMNYKTFMSYNFIGGILWVFSLILVGFSLGELVPEVKNYIEFIVIGLVIVTTIPVIRTFIKERNEQKAKKAAEEEVNL